MKKSEQTNELFAALVAARAEITNAGKSKKNPFFNAKYADLETVQDACHDALMNHGICVIQGTEYENGVAYVETLFGHTSGQWISCRAGATPKDQGPQAVGSTFTYLRRYGLAAMAGVAQTDDDGESAEGRTPQAAKQTQQQPVSRIRQSIPTQESVKQSAVAKLDQTEELTTPTVAGIGATAAPVQEVKTGQVDDFERAKLYQAVGVELTRLKWPTPMIVENLKNRYGVQRVSQLTPDQAKEYAVWLQDIKPQVQDKE